MSAAFVECLVGGVYHAEWVRDLCSVQQRSVERCFVGAGEVQGPPLDLIVPLFGLIKYWLCWGFSGSVRNYVQQRTPAGIYVASGPDLAF